MWALVKAWPRRHTRVYILPTRMGGYLNGLLFLMFLMAVGYSNNLLLLMTLLLFAFNLMWVIQSHYHLKNLSLNRVYVEDGHAEGPLRCQVEWSRIPPGPAEWKLSIETLDLSIPVHDGMIILPKRGKWHWRYLKVQTTRPFGLYQTWIYHKLDLQTFTYPALGRIGSPVLFHGSSAYGESALGHRGAGDVNGLLPYSGEDARKISWKHYARTRELVVKDFEDIKAHEAFFQWTGLEREDKEVLLQDIAGQMIYCSQNDIPFSLKTPFSTRGPAGHSMHLHQCLKDLALC